MCVPSLLWRPPARFYPPSLPLPLTGGREPAGVATCWAAGSRNMHHTLSKGEARSAGGFLRQESPPRKENFKVIHHSFLLILAVVVVPSVIGRKKP